MSLILSCPMRGPVVLVRIVLNILDDWRNLIPVNDFAGIMMDPTRAVVAMLTDLEHAVLGVICRG